ncbi:cell wall-binding repeat-containing protein [Uniformispora flossi]|uniref:cell wall-binding repeat-containing protein n=1 Tax=Uniformispora flossi TaxID=3390723 RepID=UPI003C2B232E
MTTAAPSAYASADTEVLRLWGDDSAGTAAAASQSLWKDNGNANDSREQAKAVVLSRWDHYGDGLVGGPLAAAKQGPLLLTPPTSLHGQTEAEIKRILAPGGTVYLLGGTGALSTGIEDRIRQLGFNPVRLGGPLMWDTNVRIANETTSNPSFIMVATGLSYYDALSAGAAAGSSGGVVLLSNGTSLPQQAKDYINAHPSTTLYAVGGPASTALWNGTNRAYYELAGADATDTAIAVAAGFGDDQHPVRYAGVATIRSFHDAMSGGALAASMGGPVLLSGYDSLDWRSWNYLSSKSSSLYWADVYGGTGALSAQVEKDVRAAVGAASLSAKNAPQSFSAQADNVKAPGSMKFTPPAGKLVAAR